ncbi:unnamed protein product [Arabidopsis halleri]
MTFSDFEMWIRYANSDDSQSIVANVFSLIHPESLFKGSRTNTERKNMWLYFRILALEFRYLIQRLLSWDFCLL